MSALALRSTALLLVALVLAACGDDGEPEAEIPYWAKVALDQIAEAKKHGVPVAFENDLGMRFVLIPAGTFIMGDEDPGAGNPEDAPRHRVTIANPFYLQTTEVTNEQFAAHAPNHDSGDYEGSSLDGPMQPVVRVTWDEARVFAGWLSGRSKEHDYRLPTEAEWEYACRSGTTSTFSFGDTLSPQQAHYGSGFAELPGGAMEPPKHSVDVASYPPNAWGLHDMHGNVWEWCLDWLAPIDERDGVDPVGVEPCDEQAGVKVTRGGSWDDGALDAFDEPGYVRSAERNGWTWWQRGRDVGFRLVVPLPISR